MKLSSGHFESNAHVILEVLKTELAQNARVLEIASGYGQHAAYFAEHMPAVHWQPSDIEPAHLASISCYVDEAGLVNLLSPLTLDAREPWPVTQMDAIVSINLLHVSAREACIGVLENAGKVLSDDGLLFFYGPFIRSDVDTAPSNLMFDQRLKMRDPSWGVPRLDEVSQLAHAQGLQLKTIYEVPSNNVIVVFKKSTSAE